MQSTENVIRAMQTQGSKGEAGRHARESLTRIYRQLYNENLYISAGSRLYANKGALTPGATSETVDGMGLAKIRRTICLIRLEKYRWTAGSRHYILRNDGRKRALGLLLYVINW